MGHTIMPKLKSNNLVTMLAGLHFVLLLLFMRPLMSAEGVTVSSGEFQTAVLELYTSEGCSSCPPADRWFNELVKLPEHELDVLALAFHVDYWDYIGWEDIYAEPNYTNRQRHLARVNQQSSVYTPEFFVNGIEARGTRSVIDKIMSTSKLLSTVDLELTLQQDKDSILIELSSQFDPKHKPLVRFVVFENDLSSDVKKGENAGKQFHHQQVVRYLSPKKSLLAEISYSIKIKAQWKLENVGIAALVKNKKGEHLQVVSSQLIP